jgi:hypothetical protein
MACSTHDVKRNAYGILARNPEGRRPLGKPRRRWKDSIKMGRREKWMGGMEWSRLAQNRDQWRALVNSVTNLRIP